MGSYALGCRKSCVYFTRLTVSEDGLYLPLPSECRAQFLKQSVMVPAVQSILRAYADRFAIDLLAEMQCPSAKNVDQRILEAGMYAAFAFFLEYSFNLAPNAVAFYSSGVAPALMFAHALSPDAYLKSLAPFHSANRAAYVAVEKQFDLAQSRLESDTCEDLESFIESVLTDAAFNQRVYIKDRRHRHTVLVAGMRSEVARVRSMAAQAFTSVAKQNPKLVATSSAHLPLYDHTPLAAMLNDVSFKAPRFTLIGIDGEGLTAGTQDQPAMRRLVAHAAMGLMDTGNVVKEAAQLSDRLVVVGSPFGARVLDRTHLAGYPKVEPGVNLIADQKTARLAGNTART